MKLVALTLVMGLGLGGLGCASAPAAGAMKNEAHPRAPDFSLTDTEGQTVALHDLLKHGPVILAFFPKAFTAG